MHKHTPLPLPYPWPLALSLSHLPRPNPNNQNYGYRTVQLGNDTRLYLSLVPDSSFDLYNRRSEKKGSVSPSAHPNKDPKPWPWPLIEIELSHASQKKARQVEVQG